MKRTHIEYDEIMPIKESEKSRVCLAAVKEYDFPVIVKRIKNGNEPVIEAIAQIKNAHLQKTLAYAVEGDELIVVAEYVGGRTLVEYLEEERPDARTKLALFLQLCEAVNCLHCATKTIIHRDIKPENIIITDEGQVVLIDFDAARFYNPEHRFADTQPLGTKGYAAPEQFGYMQTDERSDIFALGFVLRDLFGTDRIRQKRKEEGKPDREGRAVLKIVEKCTRFEPTERYQSVVELEKAVGSIGKRNVGVWYAAFGGVAIACVLFVVIWVAGGGSRTISPTESIDSKETMGELSAEVTTGAEDKSTEQAEGEKPVHTGDMDPEQTEGENAKHTEDKNPEQQENVQGTKQEELTKNEEEPNSGETDLTKNEDYSENGTLWDETNLAEEPHYEYTDQMAFWDTDVPKAENDDENAILWFDYFLNHWYDSDFPLHASNEQLISYSNVYYGTVGGYAGIQIEEKDLYYQDGVIFITKEAMDKLPAGEYCFILCVKYVDNTADEWHQFVRIHAVDEMVNPHEKLILQNQITEFDMNRPLDVVAIVRTANGAKIERVTDANGDSVLENGCCVCADGQVVVFDGGFIRKIAEEKKLGEDDVLTFAIHFDNGTSRHKKIVIHR